MPSIVDEPLANKLMALGELSSLASVEMPRQKVLELFASKIHSLFGASSIAIWEYDPQKKTIKLSYGHEISADMQKFCAQPIPIALFPEVEFSIESTGAWITEDITDSPLYQNSDTQRLLQSLPAQAAIGVPLRALTKIMGALSLYYAKPQTFMTEDKALISAYANALALSLNNIESYANLARSEHTKSEIVRIVAHQLRTPITTLRGNVSLLQDESIANNLEDRTKILSDMHSVVMKLRSFVESFLNVKSIDEGLLNPKPVPTDINSFMEAVISELETFRTQHGITLKFNPGPEKLSINIDPALVKEAVLNVVNNGIKYAKKNVVVDVKEEEEEVIITVQDDGLGIPENEQHLIFQRLFRASNVQRHPEASSGLGLYIAHQYIEANAGRIWFTSEGINKGTTFYIAFPNIKWLHPLPLQKKK